MKASAIRYLLGTALLLPLVPAWPAETIRIAFVGGLSGPYALQDEEALKSVEMIADIVNTRGGVLGGKKIEIIAFDNKANPQESLIVLKQAIDRDIHYVISGRSNIALAITDAVAKHNARNPERTVLFFNYSGVDPALTEAKCNFWHFRFSPHADMLVNVLTDHMAKQPSAHRVYLINQDYAYQTRYKSITHLDYLSSIRPVQMVANAMDKAGSTDPVKVAFALEGMTYEGPTGNSWMRAEDHQTVKCSMDRPSR
jgi:branched-chain amino acid transport system substrate-binding protein